MVVRDDKEVVRHFWRVKEELKEEIHKLKKNVEDINADMVPIRRERHEQDDKYTGIKKCDSSKKSNV